MKGFFIFGQFLAIFIGLSVYAPLCRARRNPEKQFLIPGIHTIRKSEEIGSIERIKYEITHFYELFYVTVIIVRLILTKVIQSIFLLPLSTRFFKSLQTREVERILQVPMPSMGPKSRITGQITGLSRYNTRSRSKQIQNSEAKNKFLDQLNLRPADDSLISNVDGRPACHQKEDDVTNKTKTRLNICLKQFYPLSIVNRKYL